jgi:hypothetical protein
MKTETKPKRNPYLDTAPFVDKFAAAIASGAKEALEGRKEQ